MDCLYQFQSIHLKHYTVKPETLTSFMIDVFSQSNLGNILRRVHTNPLKCALDQIASNRFESIRIRSVHTLVSESEFDYGLRKIYLLAHDDMKVYLEIYAL